MINECFKNVAFEVPHLFTNINEALSFMHNCPHCGSEAVGIDHLRKKYGTTHFVPFCDECGFELNPLYSVFLHPIDAAYAWNEYCKERENEQRNEQLSECARNEQEKIKSRGVWKVNLDDAIRILPTPMIDILCASESVEDLPPCIADILLASKKSGR